MNAKPAARGPRPCRCSEYFVADETEVSGQPEFDNVVTTGCTKQVAGRTLFAPGHDAKLKSLLINAKRTGRGAAVKRDNGVLTHFSSAESAAGEYGFYSMVANAGTAKAPADRKAKASKAEAPAEPVAPAAPALTTIKVGRWTYGATINRATGRATYRNGKGVEVSTSRFTVVDADNAEIPF